ncbi:FixH family protein [Mycobacterium sp. 21AC1]|uniref:FixH family protein n=1 Tax=[Mycobacterium] appelbergii TaxID=2939269 RepID=UPI00293949A1|nr:FixH family protein [Mycobacterium sp. 21AC1]MDV3129820.1 FixH family protein [Mycobacterium sp. 21AC1]
MNRNRILIVIAVVAAVVGAGIWLLWPKPAAPRVTAAAGPYLVRLSGESPTVGVSPLTVEISGRDGAPPTPDTVTFEPAMPQMGHATTPVVASAEGNGRYRGDIDLSMPGQWEITVRIATGGQTHNAVLSITTNG